MDVEKQVAIIWTATNGYLDDVPVERVKEFETQYVSFLENAKGGLLDAIRTKKAVDDEIKAELASAAEDFKARFSSKSATA
jgi:F-type H+-transporting ATPase subunit alpha